MGPRMAGELSCQILGLEERLLSIWEMRKIRMAFGKANALEQCMFSNVCLRLVMVENHFEMIYEH